MNKLAIFDLDGVLVDLKDVHFHALNYALESCGYAPISKDDHLARFDGLPTSTKLKMLGVCDSDFEKIGDLKQKETLRQVAIGVNYDPSLVRVMARVSEKGFKIAVVSNAKRETVKQCLHQLELQDLVSNVITPDTYLNAPKPSPRMYEVAMEKCGAKPSTTIIFEDSPAGLKGAYESGARVVQVSGKLDLKQVLDAINEEQKYKYFWYDLAVIIPAAGKGQRFKDAGYATPKPFMPVNGKSMLLSVVENLGVSSSIGFVVQEDHNTQERSAELRKTGSVVLLHEYTSGTAWTCLIACEALGINDCPARPLLIANSDQILEWDHIAFYYFCQNTSLDGVIVVFDCPEKSERWSYCEVNDGLVSRVTEKDPISEVANVGVFFWKKSSDFVKYAERMIVQNRRVNGEFYLAPVYNLAIEDGKKIGVFRVDKFHSLGTPEDYTKYVMGAK